MMGPLRAGLATFSLFLAGVVIGALGMRLVEAHHGAERPLDLRELDLSQHELLETLDLDDQQQAVVHDVLLRASERARELHEQLVPAVLDHLDQTKAEVAAVLRPDQRERLEELHRSHRNEFHNFLLRHGAGHGDHGGGRHP